MKLRQAKKIWYAPFGGTSFLHRKQSSIIKAMLRCNRALKVTEEYPDPKEPICKHGFRSCDLCDMGV